MGRNGYLPERTIQTSIGDVACLIFKGISTCRFNEALEALLGKQAKVLSSSTSARLKQIWQEEYTKWPKCDLSSKGLIVLALQFVYHFRY